MFVIVKFGNNESLLVNPSCAVINLLTSIKRRAGFGNTNKTIDLSDENALLVTGHLVTTHNVNRHLVTSQRRHWPSYLTTRDVTGHLVTTHDATGHLVTAHDVTMPSSDHS
ncbi:hypothetical protein Btru_062441 [Bulinus truncatus]|nr:hypothetical protein Btru_062441 [Bulinus truncatus]